MSKSLVLYTASNGCICEDGDTVYIASGSDALAKVVQNIQTALGNVEFSLNVTPIEAPTLTTDQVQITPKGAGWTLFTSDAAFIYTNVKEVTDKFTELIKARLATYAEGTPYLISIPVVTPEPPPEE